MASRIAPTCSLARKAAATARRGPVRAGGLLRAGLLRAGLLRAGLLRAGLLAGWVLVGCWLPSCVADQDDSGPELVVELFWEDGSDGVRDDSETCGTAGVAFISWRLVLVDDGFDEVIAESEPDEVCVNTLGFGDIPPGAYRLEVRGDDGPARTAWRGICDELFVDRFDELYGCRVFLVDDSATERRMPGMRMGSADAGAMDAAPARSDGGME